MATLIGTPPNIVIASFREDALGEPFAMLDFAPVGLACATAGLAFIALIGWRLIPQSHRTAHPAERLAQSDNKLICHCSETIRPGDALLVEATPEALEEFKNEHELEYESRERRKIDPAGEGLSLMQVVVPESALIVGRGPGGYAFRDYWRMGLPLEVIIIAIAVPGIQIFWPY